MLGARVVVLGQVGGMCGGQRWRKQEASRGSK